MPALNRLPTRELDSATMTRNAVARPIGDTAVLVTMRRGSRGPWSVVVDEPAAGGEPLGPPPGFLALVGIGSCTIVTVAGVASRGVSELHGMRVEFEVTAGALEIRQRTTLVADLSERDHLRLTRAVAHCPVGRDFTKRAVDVEDVIEVTGRSAPVDAGVGAVGGSTGSDGNTTVPAGHEDALPAAFVPGSVRADWLTATREWRDLDGVRILDQEGEVKAHVASDIGGAPRRWGFLGGHSTAGWAPRPSSYALGALAASSLITLRSAAPGLGLDPASIEVEVEVVSAVPAGGKEASQERAAAGDPARVRWRRTIRAAAVAPSVDPQAVRAAARRDPLLGYIERGDLLASETIEVVSPAAGLPG